MHVVVVYARTEGVNLRLSFKKREDADALLSQLEIPKLNGGVIHLTDDYGHRGFINPIDIAAVFVADIEGEYKAIQTQNLAQARAQLEFQQSVQNDPKLRLLASVLEARQRAS